MNAIALRALKGSIRKWERIVAGKQGDKGTDNCPLCKLYFWNECEGCPVFVKTKQSGCDGTPYKSFCDDQGDGWNFNQMADTPKRIRAAKAQVKFLKSLLPR